jgi:hypothetical protein
MRFGFFDQLSCAPGYSEPQRYKDIIAQIELDDAVGFDTAWLGEIHFIREFSILADPRIVLAAAAQRTRVPSQSAHRSQQGGDTPMHMRDIPFSTTDLNVVHRRAEGSGEYA